jgi:hypothetical protein
MVDMNLNGLLTFLCYDQMQAYGGGNVHKSHIKLFNAFLCKYHTLLSAVLQIQVPLFHLL